ncbi:MAG: hypothetical protein ACFFDM_12185 [Candidatus Thorarchaeota archaeon]
MSLSLAIFWQLRITSNNTFIDDLVVDFGEPDISGDMQYTNCKSHRWVMRNVVFGDYSKTGEWFRNFMMNRTLIGTLVLGSFLGLIPVIIVYFLFQSFNLIGVSLVLIFIAVYVAKGPGNVEVSSKLICYLIEDDKSNLSSGDVAYASISQRTIESWRTKLLLLGIASIVISPWGEQIPISLIWFLTQFLGWAYVTIFLPLSGVSMPLALVSYFGIGPLIFGIAGITIRLIVNRVRNNNEVGLSVIASGVKT